MKKFIAIAAIIVLSVIGCGKEKEAKKAETKNAPAPIQAPAQKKARYEIPEEQKTLLARVNSTPIYMEDLHARTLQELINEEILYIEALRRGINESPKIKDLPEERKKTVIIMTIKSDIMRSLPKPSKISDEEARKYYNENIGKYSSVTANQIVVPDKSLAEEIHKKALAGGDFEKIASEYTTAGKELTVNQKKLRKRENSIFKRLEVGSVSDIREKGDTYEILQISEVLKLPFERIKVPLKYTINSRKNSVIVKKMIEQFKKDNNINIEIVE